MVTFFVLHQEQSDTLGLKRSKPLKTLLSQARPVYKCCLSTWKKEKEKKNSHEIFERNAIEKNSLSYTAILQSETSDMKRGHFAARMNPLTVTLYC